MTALDTYSQTVAARGFDPRDRASLEGRIAAMDADAVGVERTESLATYYAEVLRADAANRSRVNAGFRRLLTVLLTAGAALAALIVWLS